MFMNERVNHKKYGFGTVVDLEVKNPEIESLVTVDFDEVEEKRIAIWAFGSKHKLIEPENLEVREYVDKLEEEEESRKEKEKQERIEKEKKERLAKISYFNEDEFEKPVSKEQWESAKEVAGTHRFYYESRAVVMDTGKVFINASAGSKFVDGRAKDGDKLYKACEIGVKYMGHKWSYATREEIDRVMELMENNAE